jgi:uncharacterized protein YbcI
MEGRWLVVSDRNQPVVDEMVRAMTRFFKDRLGRGPEGYRTYLVDDMIVIRFLKTLTSAEYEMAKTSEGRRSVKDTHGRLMGELRPGLEELIRKSTGADVISVHSDLSTRTGESVNIFVLDRKVRQLPGGSHVDP